MALGEREEKHQKWSNQKNIPHPRHCIQFKKEEMTVLYFKCSWILFLKTWLSWSPVSPPFGNFPSWKIYKSLRDEFYSGGMHIVIYCYSFIISQDKYLTKELGSKTSSGSGHFLIRVSMDVFSTWFISNQMWSPNRYNRLLVHNRKYSSRAFFTEKMNKIEKQE